MVDVLFKMPTGLTLGGEESIQVILNGYTILHNKEQDFFWGGD